MANPKIVTAIGAVAKWAASDKGKETMKSARKFVIDHETEIRAASDLARGIAGHVSANAKQAVKNFKEELNKKE